MAGKRSQDWARYIPATTITYRAIKANARWTTHMISTRRRSQR
jgi:hypothetical protein